MNPRTVYGKHWLSHMWQCPSVSRGRYPFWPSGQNKVHHMVTRGINRWTGGLTISSCSSDQRRVSEARPLDYDSHPLWTLCSIFKSFIISDFIFVILLYSPLFSFHRRHLCTNCLPCPDQSHLISYKRIECKHMLVYRFNFVIDPLNFRFFASCFWVLFCIESVNVRDRWKNTILLL